MREICARKLECFRRLGLVFVYLSGVLIVTASLELFDAVFIQFFIGLARGVVIGRHLCLSRAQKPRSSSDSCAVISHESTDMRAMCARARYNAVTCLKFPLQCGFWTACSGLPAMPRYPWKRTPKTDSMGCLAEGCAPGFTEIRTAIHSALIPACPYRSHHWLVRLLLAPCRCAFQPCGARAPEECGVGAGG